MNYDGSQAPGWIYPNHVLITKLAASEFGRLFFLENLEHNYVALDRFKSGDKLLVLIGAYFDQWNFEYAKKCFVYQNPGFDLKSIYWLANTPAQAKMVLDLGFNVLEFNHNSFIDEYTFQIQEEPKIYNLVMNARPENVKRPWLAMKVPHIAAIKGKLFSPNNFGDLGQLHPDYLNQERITLDEVVTILNQSYVGGIFSEKEGACFASSEYLLCGLPVVSTICSGGREIWYNDYNSLIVEPDEYAIAQAVELLANKVKDKKIDPYQIREHHIALSLIQRDRLHRLLNEFIEDLKVEISAEQIYQKILRDWSTVHEVENLDRDLFQEN